MLAKGNKTYEIAEMWIECKRAKCTLINNATKKIVNSKNLTYNIYTIYNNKYYIIIINIYIIINIK